jgi:hypothetical protein
MFKKKSRVLFALLLLCIALMIFYVFSQKNELNSSSDEARKGESVVIARDDSPQQMPNNLHAEKQSSYGEPDSVEMLFLGNIKTYVKELPYKYMLRKDGQAVEWKWKVHRDERGYIIRIEFRRENSLDIRHDRETNEQNYRSREQIIHKLPDTPSKFTAEELIEKLMPIFDSAGELNQANHIEINYVVFSLPYGDGSNPIRNMYIVNTWGLTGIDSFTRQHVRLRRVRYLFDENLNPIMADNNL